MAGRFGLLPSFYGSMLCPGYLLRYHLRHTRYCLWFSCCHHGNPEDLAETLPYPHKGPAFTSVSPSINFTAWKKYMILKRLVGQSGWGWNDDKQTFKQMADLRVLSEKKSFKTVKLCFKLPYYSQWRQSLLVCGFKPVLGSWNMKKGVWFKLQIHAIPFKKKVSTPEVIRSSADWQAKKVRKKKQRNPNRKKNQQGLTTPTTAANSTSVAVAPDVWCSPGIGYVADDAPVDCVVARRPVAGRGRVYGERMNHRERSYTTRRTSNLENISVLDSPSAFETLRSGADVFGDRHYRHFRRRSPGGLAEIVMFQNSLLLGGRSDKYDQYREWRLDVDNMSYEELLELGDRIGYVSTGLREDDIFHCLRKNKHLIMMDDFPSSLPTESDWKCSICQEDYKADDEVGKLDCGHIYHICCIKQWLLQKNACPVCKSVAAVQY
ncbi:hypothetical protein NE237_021236 [Protea cynaroides]|uniref:RING-type E3 ubiquitin transferase n=1 Tax=Protea cynaroides TaxID=273540 RepID=A0A9Q0H7G7_9MAGN|nr:hypothetical protein NE237_021236 [Protea cynaroides]